MGRAPAGRKGLRGCDAVDAPGAAIPQIATSIGYDHDVPVLHPLA